MTVAAIIAAHNEESRIAATVRTLESAGRASEIVVVDDGSTDETAAKASAAGARVIRLHRNAGKGAAVAAGLRATTAPILLLCDADLEETASALFVLVDPVMEGRAVMTVAAPPATGSSGFGLVESFARWGIRRLTGVHMTRPLSGQRAILRSAFPSRTARGFGIEVGLTVDVLRAGHRVLEIPVVFNHARTGRNVAGFVHRARQGAHVAAALAARTTTKGGPA